MSHPLFEPSISLRDLCVMTYGHGITQWAYRAPAGHTSGVLADPSYWSDARDTVKPGDWLFVVHTAPQGPYNAIYAFTNGPLGIWAQQLLSSVPTIGNVR